MDYNDTIDTNEGDVQVGSGIHIENSDHVTAEGNLTIGDAGITLKDVTNSTLRNNTHYANVAPKNVKNGTQTWWGVLGLALAATVIGGVILFYVFGIS